MITKWMIEWFCFCSKPRPLIRKRRREKNPEQLWFCNIFYYNWLVSLLNITCHSQFLTNQRSPFINQNFWPAIRWFRNLPFYSITSVWFLLSLFNQPEMAIHQLLQQVKTFDQQNFGFVTPSLLFVFVWLVQSLFSKQSEVAIHWQNFVIAFLFC